LFTIFDHFLAILTIFDHFRPFLTIFDHFLTIIFIKEGGGGLAQSKKSLLEKTEVVKEGGGGVSVFFTKSKKTVFLRLPLHFQHGKENGSQSNRTAVP